MFSCYLCALPVYPSSLPIFALSQRRTAAERVRLSVGFSGQKAACRLGKQPSKCMCNASGSQPMTRPLQAADCGSPLPKVNKCAVFTRPPTCYGNLSAINLKGIIVLYYILPRAEGDRFAQASKHVPRVGRGRCAAFFFSPGCCLPART
jgi:hypothetical protein